MITVYTRFYTPAPGEKVPALEHRIGRELLAVGLKELYGISVQETPFPGTAETDCVSDTGQRATTTGTDDSDLRTSIAPDHSKRQMANVTADRQTSMAVPDTWITVGPHKKPTLAAYPDIHFNISHCHGLVACAFAPFPVGIDVEHIRPFRDHLLHRVLTPEEQAQLEAFSTTEEKRQEWFFRFWTLKESRIKQSGTGMSVRLSSFSFRISPKGTVTGSDEDLCFQQRLLRDSYVLSVCTPKCPGSSPENTLQITEQLPAT